MTKQEFTERTGINPTEEEFDKIHDLYMLTGAEMDKDSFCAAYMSCKDMTLVNALYHNMLFSTSRLKEERDSIKEELERDGKTLGNLWEKTDEAVVGILKVAYETNNKSHADLLNRIAVSLVGQFNVWMTKLEKNYALNKEERIAFFDEIANLKGQIEEYKSTGKIDDIDRKEENR